MDARFGLSRLASIRRHLTYANTMASIALFIALGGGAYAAVHVNGKDIKNRTIAGKKVKNNTLSGKQINEKRLGQVPNAARAEFAAQAGSAASAATAATLGGDPPSAFVVSCPAATTIYGGVCWDNTPRASADWFFASETCGDAGGRLPSLSELVAYATQDGIQIGSVNPHWSGDVDSAMPVEAAHALETAQGSDPAALLHPYRCVFYRSN